MTHNSACQSMLDIINMNRELIEKHSTYQLHIDNLLNKIPTSDNGAKSLSILIQSELRFLSGEVTKFGKLLQESETYKIQKANEPKIS